MRIKFFLTKIGIDGHDRGVKAITFGLRNAGMEVIYTGPWQTVSAVVNTAIQEDPDIIGVSTLGGDYILMPELLNQLSEKEVNIPVVIGGIIPGDVEKEMRKYGVADVFHPGTPIEEIVQRIEKTVKNKKLIKK